MRLRIFDGPPRYEHPPRRGRVIYELHDGAWRVLPWEEALHDQINPNFGPWPRDERARQLVAQAFPDAHVEYVYEHPQDS